MDQRTLSSMAVEKTNNGSHVLCLVCGPVMCFLFRSWPVDEETDLMKLLTFGQGILLYSPSDRPSFIILTEADGSSSGYSVHRNRSVTNPN